MEDPIEERLKNVIVANLSVQMDMVTRQATLKNLGADSLDIVELIMEVEEEFGIKISDAEAEKIKNVGELIDYIKNELARNLPPAA